MPSYWNDDFESFEQDWEPVVLKRPANLPHENTQTNTNNEIPLHRKIALARSQNDYTQHQFCQLIHMKVKDYIKLEKGLLEPSTETLKKIRKYLNIKI